MTLDEASVVLGVPSSASTEEAGAAYQVRVRQLQQSQVAGSMGDRHDPAMQRLGEAMSAFQARAVVPAQPSPFGPWGAPSSGPVQTARMPGVGECTTCGWGPAAPLTLWRTTGVVLFWRWQRSRLTLCRVCGEGFFADRQSKTLAFGWWGFIAPIASLVNLTRNYLAIQKHRRLPMPQHRAPEVRTPFSAPPPFTPLGRRAGTWIGPILAGILLVLGIVNAVLQPPTDSSGGGSAGPIGTCVTAGYETVGCSSPDAAYRIYAHAVSADGCPTGDVTLTSDSDQTYCAEPVR